MQLILDHWFTHFQMINKYILNDNNADFGCDVPDNNISYI